MTEKAPQLTAETKELESGMDATVITALEGLVKQLREADPSLPPTFDLICFLDFPEK